MTIGIMAFGVFLAVGLSLTCQAEGQFETLQARIDASAEGAVLKLDAGIHQGPIVIDRPLTLSGEPGAIIDGGGVGNIILIAAPDVTIDGLELRHSGRDVGTMDSAVFVAEGGDRAKILNNRMTDVTFGVWLDKGRDIQVIGNRIDGNLSLRNQDRGNGIHLFASEQCLVKDNVIKDARDGIYIDTSDHNRLIGNTLTDLRYGIHYMYSNDNDVIGNLTQHTRTGYALMQSRNLRVENNVSKDDENYGLLLNFITYSTLIDNRVIHAHNPQGAAAIEGAEGKGLFIYNSLFNDIRGNLIEASDLGIHLTAGSEDNRLYENVFIGNRTQVKYVSSRNQEWSFEGRGNYWSDYLGWDLDGDGLGDRAYQPNDGVDKLLWRYPEARVLMNSPAIEVLRWAQRQFPVLRPPGVRDSHPLMEAPNS